MSYDLSKSPPCPLCNTEASTLFHQDRHRPYLLCDHCQLVFVPSPFWLSAEDEKTVYDLHQNQSDDSGYRQFLSRLAKPLLAHLTRPSAGLDFGCGPGPVLATMIEEAGHTMDLYDPIYQPDATVFDQQYDFICATEVLEHLHHPARDLQRIFDGLKPKGILAVMTKRVRDQQAFQQWHYIRDLTHVVFYHTETFAYIADRFQATLIQILPDVVLLRRK